MKRIGTILLVAALGAGVAAQAAGAKAKRPSKGDLLLDRYDVNHNGVLDDSERAAVERDYMDRFDKNGNKKLDSEELDALRQELQKQAAKKGKKKNQ